MDDLVGGIEYLVELGPIKALDFLLTPGSLIKEAKKVLKTIDKSPELKGLKIPIYSCAISEELLRLGAYFTIAKIAYENFFH